MADAPICHVPGPGDDTQPIAPLLQSIPVATDLRSALAAIHAMRQVLMRISGQVKQQKKPTQAKPQKPKEDKKQQSRWIETSRVKETVKIKSRDDPDVFVEVERINRLTMQDKQTGEKWEWKR